MCTGLAVPELDQEGAILHQLRQTGTESRKRVNGRGLEGLGLSGPKGGSDLARAP